MVPMTSIDAIVAELSLQRLDLIKIDVEGFELDVLKGALQTIRRFRPRIVAEFNSFALIANRNLLAALFSRIRAFYVRIILHRT